MKTPHRPLFLIALSIIMIVCLISIAMSGTVKNKLNSPQDCGQDCAQRRDKMLENCNQLAGEAGDRCREISTKNYDKCMEGCNSDKGGDMKGGKRPE